MKAVLMTEMGAPEVLVSRDVPEPEITTATQIKVKLKAAGVNPVDTKLRGRGLFFDGNPPAILGCDGAGEVIAKGDSVSRFQLGDEVWFCHGGLGREAGNYAEYAVLEESRAEFKPGNMDFVHAAASPLVLITAWEALFDRGKLQPGQTVLVHAGAGGVGHVAIQLAKIKGARVITTVSSDEKAEFVRSLGADEVINYRQQDLQQAIDDWTGGRGVDLVFDTVGPEVFRQSIPLLAHYGTLVTILDPGDALLNPDARNKNLTIAFTLMLSPDLFDLEEAQAHQLEILRMCKGWISEGKLKVEVSQTFPLADAAEAHRIIEEGHTSGKLVLEV